MHAKFLSIEEMRNRRFNPIAATTSNLADPLNAQDRVLQRGKGVGSAAQIALFKEETRQRLAAKLTSVFEETKNTHLARQMAKDRVKAKVEIKNARLIKESRND